MVKVAENVLKRVERDHVDGITSAALLAFFAEQEIRFGEATLRKWVQLGLLPRSVRVGRKGKHQGSKGLYPVRVVRQIIQIKEMMARNLTIEEIKEQFLFVRGDIQELEHTLGNIFRSLERVAHDRGDKVMGVRAVSADVARARTLATDLVDKLEKIERRLIVEPQPGAKEVAS
jgi:hypothetical protein